MEQVNGHQVTSKRSRNQIRELLRKYDKTSGITIKAFCKLHQVSEGSFYSARKRLRASAAPLPKPAGFVALSRPAFTEATSTLFAEVNGIRLYQPVSADYLKALIP
ncbi:MAG: IS66 family insertion sequence element accessory protein TnpA [Methanobacteriaceae archaeon]